MALNHMVFLFYKIHLAMEADISLSTLLAWNPYTAALSAYVISQSKFLFQL